MKREKRVRGEGRVREIWGAQSDSSMLPYRVYCILHHTEECPLYAVIVMVILTIPAVIYYTS